MIDRHVQLMKRLRAAAVLVGLAVYLAAFYATPLSVFGRRIDLLRLLALRPDDWLLPSWFGSPLQFTFSDRLPILLIAGVILIWALLLGWLLLAAIRAWEPSPSPTGNVGDATRLTRLETFVFSMAAGLATLSTWVLLLGLLGRLNRSLVFAIPAAVTLAAVGYVARKRRMLTAPGRACESNPGDEPYGLLSARWLWLALPFVVAILLAAMLPPFDFDVCEYHLQAPKEFYQQGRISFLPHNVYANMPLGTEMLSLLAMVVSGDWWYGALAGKMVIAAFTPLCALGLFCAGRRFHSTSAGVAAALLYISTPWFASTSIIPSDVNVASSGLVEGPLACYLFLAAFSVLLWNKTRTGIDCHVATRRATGVSSSASPSRGLLLLAGYLAGAAVAVKYPAVLLVLLPSAIWVFLHNSRELTAPGEQRKGVAVRERLAPRCFPRHFRFWLRTKRLSVFLLAAALACGLWFGKNWALTGNPTYPLLYGAFDGKTWSAEKNARWNHVHRPHDFSAATLSKDLGRVTLTSPWLSPLVVPFAILAFFGWRGLSKPASKLRWQLLAYVAFVIAVWWLFTHRIDRFWIPVLPVLTLLAGFGTCWTAQRWWRWSLRGLLLAALVANFLVSTAGPGNAWFLPLAKLRTDPDWVPDPWHRYFNAHADKAVLAVGDAAVFDLKPPVLYSTCFDDCLFEQLVKNQTPAEVRAALAARRVVFVYVNWREIARYRSPGNYGFTDFVEPAVFDRLVADRVLVPLSPIKGEHGRAYRVLAEH
ncbi:MAG: hypothetical protein LLG00_03660 [Planctomycetaceae bacterium]|nr:hypothetical protein [Planctomycetaceae bacterium]